MVPTQKLNFLRLIFGTFQPQSKSRARKKKKNQRSETFSKWSAKIQGKQRFSNGKKRWERSPTNGKKWWEKVLRNLACLKTEVQGSFVANALQGHLLEFLFFPKESELFQISHPKDPMESWICFLPASQGTPGIADGMEWGRDEWGKERFGGRMGQKGQNKGKYEQRWVCLLKGIGICLELGKYPRIPN